MNSIIHQIFPDGLQTTVRRQLNRVPVPMWPLLTAVSVAGDVIDQILLVQLVEQEAYDFAVEDWLVQCVSAGILEIAQEQVRFASKTMRQTLLEALEAQEKARWHEKIGLALEAIYADNASQAATIAYHWQQVGNVAKEQRYARLAGEYACQQFDCETAVHHLTRALELTPASDLPEQYHLLLRREKVFHIQGNRDAQKDDLTQLAEIADTLSTGEQEWRTEAALRLGAFAEVTGEYTVAIVAATEALKMAKATQTPAHEAASYLLWGQALLRRGQYEEAQEKLQLSQTQAAAQQLTQIEADSLRFQGVLAVDLGQFDRARTAYEAALSIYTTVQDKRGESAVLNNLSIVAYAQNQLVDAMTHWEQARLAHEAIGDKEGLARVLSNLGSVCLDLGEYEKGQAYSQEALAICRESDLRFGQGMNLINLSLFSFSLQADQQAEIYSLAALELAQEMKSLPLEGLALKDRAYLLLQREQLADAAQTYQQALAIWQELAQPLQILETQAGLGKVALAQGNMAKADAHLQPLLAHWEAEHSFAGTSRPFFVYLVLYEMLTASDDARASAVLMQAHEHLTLFAAEMTDEAQRQAFFKNVPEHWQIHSFFGSLR